MRVNGLTMYIAIILISLLFCVPSYAATCAVPDKNLSPPAAVDAAAKKGLKALSEGEADEAEDNIEAKALGFQSFEDMTHAQLGQPLPIIEITPKQLSISELAADLESLLNQLQQPRVFIYPLCVGNEVRSSLTVRRSRSNDDQWRAVTFGAAPLIELLEEYRKASSVNVVLWMPGLNRYFLGRLSQKELSLVPIIGDPRLGFVAGQVISGDEVFTKLKSQAEAFYKSAQNKKLELDKKLDKQRPASSR
jgi:hypothetical protein